MKIQTNGLTAIYCCGGCSPFFFWLIFATVIGCLPTDRLLAQDKEDERPNILFFLTDDQRNDQLGCAGHPILKTPHIDSLAKRGVRFENAFVTTSICAASRASIFCGMTERSHRYTFGRPPLRKEVADVCYAKLLKNAGYTTGFVGKFGVRVPKGAQSEWFDSYRPVGRGKHQGPERKHMTEVAGSQAIAFLESVPAEQPFCLQVSFNAPHAEDGDKKDHYPWPPTVDGMYDDSKITPADFGAAEIFDAHPDFMKQSMNRQRFFWRWDTPEKYDRNIRGYYRMLSGIDHEIGRMLKTLQDSGQSENTIVIFSGDNGYYMGQRGFAGKWSHYEQSLRVPLIIADLRKNDSKQASTESVMALNIDIPATILAAARVVQPPLHQGRSLLPYVYGKRPSDSDWRSDFFCEHLMDNESIPKWEGVRGKRFVYARYFEQQPVFEYLHDLKKDPDQLTNFVSDPDYATTLKKMRKRCDELREQNGGVYDAGTFGKR